MITSLSGPSLTIIDGTDLSNARFMTIDEITASIHINGIQIRNFRLPTVGYFRNCQVIEYASVIQLNSGSAYIKNSIFTGHTASSCSVFYVAADKAWIVIEDTSFIDNTSINMDMCNNYCNTKGAVCIFWDASKTTAKPYSIKNATFTNNILSADNMGSLQQWCPNQPGTGLVTTHKSGSGNCYQNFNANYNDAQCYNDGQYNSIECVTPTCLQGDTNVPYTGCITTTTTVSPSSLPSPVPTPASQAMSFLGCYTDQGARAMILVNIQDPNECKAYAVSMMYKYFALQYGTQCFVSNDHASSTQ
jgi:hypothetical protein